jgi:hypothetical protein
MSFGILGLVVILITPSLSSGQATSLLQGTWKEDFAKAKLSPVPANGAPKERMLKWDPIAGGLRQSVDTITAKGEKTHTGAVEKFDGTEGKVEGDQTPTTRALKRLNDHAYEEVTRQNGKVTVTRTLTISADGKMLTVATKGTNGQGQPVNNSEVFDRM